MGRFYLILIVSLASFAWLASNLPASAPAPGRDAILAAGDAEPARPGGEAPSMAQWQGDGIVLDRAADGHFYAEVAINGRPIHMMVDTGASGVALAEVDARRAGIATTIGMNDHIGQGAGGAVYGNVVTIDSVALGGMEARDLAGVVLKGGRTSLLGQDFLRRFETVEIAGDRMVLR